MATGVPVPGSASEDDLQPDMMSIVKSLRSRISKLEKELQSKEADTREDPEKLKPIDIKDIEKPDKYDDNISKFNIWFDKFRDLLTNWHADWLVSLETCRTIC